MRLFDISADGVDPDLIGDRCWAAGAAGIWEIDDRVWRVGVDDADADAFARALADREPVDVTATAAVELATRDVVVDGASLSVPPTVFGDGEHPTTVGCLAALADTVRIGDRVLDVGCGSGVLSVAAARAGGVVTAVDIDEVAVRTTADNAGANEVAVAVSTTPLAAVAGRYEVVVANITAGSIAPLLADLVRCANDPGTLIVSGILDDQWPGIESEIRGLWGDPAPTVVHSSRDGWVTGVVSSRR